MKCCICNDEYGEELIFIASLFVGDTEGGHVCCECEQEYRFTSRA
jgi:hypothetical protein